MTTYTQIGFVLEENKRGDVVGIRDSKLKIAVKDSVESVSYKVTGTADDGEPTVTWAGVAYSVRADGIEIGNVDPDTELTNQVLKVTWNGGAKTTYVANFYDEVNKESYVFAIGGDTLPDFSSVAQFNSFMGGASLSNPGKASGFAAGDDISFADFPGVKVTEDDVVRGTNLKDVINAGLGNDKIYGKGGADTLIGGIGKDKLFGDAGSDKLLGGDGSDVLKGGEKGDRLDGGKGTDKLFGQEGSDKFVFKKGYGKDTVADFQNNKDTLLLDDALWSGSLTKKQVLNKFASVQDGDVVLDFGKHELTIENFTNIKALTDDIDFI
ncbi:calcium-binding protein [Tropicimonas marinistellae]|uniref:calcium-binding protein n=1 Tax=Tropicimonas marinistellae TaxID=1739787 RepID=UPI0008343093|nr:calcium-binding protein [Tropicimonas marinistellae]